MSHWFEVNRRRFLQAVGALSAALWLRGLPQGRAQSKEEGPFRAGGFDPDALYLTWIDNPCTTMTVQWHTTAGETRGKALHFQKADGRSGQVPEPAPVPGPAWTRVKATSKPLPGTTRDVQTAMLTGLEPGTAYAFFLEPSGPVYKFRTLPEKLVEPVRFIVAGDIYKVLDKLTQAFKTGARQEPDFAVLAGDIAYDNGRLDMVSRCVELLALWKRLMVRSDGCLVPILPLMGNHELAVWKEAPEPAEKAEAFYALYALPGGKAYRSLDAGDYLTLFLLDSDHTNAVDGEQLAWLKSHAKARQGATHKMPVYHVPAYPSSRNNTKVNKRVLEHWVPVFEASGVGFAFEHHDHTFKRTFPIRGNKAAEDGIVYFGDGGWAMAQPRVPRKPEAEGNWMLPGDTRWYLARTGSVNHFHLCTVWPDRREVRSINLEGTAFDVTRQDVKTRRFEVVSTGPMAARDEPAASANAD